MAVATPNRAVHHGLPSPMRSPTLSDAGMILPAGNARSFSPNPYIEHPPSPPILYAQRDFSHVKLGSAPQGRQRAATVVKSPQPQLSSRSSRSTLRNMADVEAAASKSPRAGALASSPTIASPTIQDAINWAPKIHPRKLSAASSSIHSEDLDSWPGFDSHGGFDDSGLGLDEHEKGNIIPSAMSPGDESVDGWMNGRNSGSSEDDHELYSAALSRRAEMILANAKKRLNVMEGNLRGARESLVVSPTLSTVRSNSELSLHINAARERDRRLYAGIGPIPPRSYRASPLLPNIPSHSRGLSETSVSSPYSAPFYTSRTTTNKRASSAFGHTSGPWSAEGFGQGRFPIKESRSYEVMRDPKTTWNAAEQQQMQHTVRASSRGSRSPPALATLPEDEDGPRVHRSSSAASGLRDQMNDLKGRISSLKQRANEDSMRRRSMQNMRTPSPFNHAQEWHTSGDSHQVGAAPHTTNTGLGIRTGSPTRREMSEEERVLPQPTREVHIQDPKESATKQFNGHDVHLADTHAQYDVDEEEVYDVDEQDVYDGEQNVYDDEQDVYDDEQDVYETNDAEFVSVNGDNLESGADSIYEDAVYEMPATERHEDRLDAFDYEHFFLHSAMGTYSLEGRRSSSAGSDSSTETTRPVTAVQDQDDIDAAEKRVSYHSRNASADSVSTMASFATAVENHSDDDEDSNEQMDQFSQQILAQQRPPIRPGISGTRNSFRSDSAINMRRANGTSSPPTQSTVSRTSSSPANLASGLQVSKLYSILTGASSPSSEEPRLALSEEEKQLIYSLAASVQQVCSDLQHSHGDQYERKAWRRRLHDARRVLNGEEFDNEQSF